MEKMNNQAIFQLIKKAVLGLLQKKAKPVRIAINGIEGTGKTVFAGKLTEYLKSETINAIHIPIDGFHFNRAVRYKQGRNSGKGYYEDSYDELAFVEKVLQASQSANPNYTKATHDLETDEYLDLEVIPIANNAVLISDGAYLFKPNYRDHWDLKIYLKTSFEVAMNRGIERDKNALGGFDSTKEKYEKRYHKASKIYITENEPERIADIIIENTDFDNLKIVKDTTANL